MYKNFQDSIRERNGNSQIVMDKLLRLYVEKKIKVCTRHQFKKRKQENTIRKINNK